MFEERVDPPDEGIHPDPEPDQRDGVGSDAPPPGQGGEHGAAVSTQEHEPPLDGIDPLAPLEASQRMLQRAEAARAVALLDAYVEAMAEMDAVFGPGAGDRDGPFARSFLLEAAQVLHLHERTVGILLDAAESLRRSFPRSWAVFLDGRITWREVELVWRQAQGLDADRQPEYDEEAAALLGEVPISRLKDRLHRLRERLQADTAG